MNRETLMHSLQTGRILHAVLFAGEQGTGRKALLHAAAAMYLFQTEDMARLAEYADYKEKRPPYRTEEVRDFIAEMAVQPFFHGRRVFAFLDAHEMNPQSQNALLRSIEEPPADTLVLLSGNEAALLPTIRSRCAVVRLGAQSVEAVQRALEAEGVEKESAAVCAAWADGVAGMARRYATDAYMAFRRNAGDCLDVALFGGSPFPQAAELLKAPVWELTGNQKQTNVNAALLLSIWSSILRDALVTGMGGAPLLNPDRKKQTARIAERFTTKRIQGIIHILSDGQKRLFDGASGTLAVDAVLSAMMAPLTERENKRS